MKKHLIAAAVAGALAVPAMAQVEIYGVFSGAYSQTELKVTEDGVSRTLKSTDSAAQGQQAGNRVGFRGTEDLGGGMSAGFVYELGANLASGLGANRLGYLQLQGGFGTVRVGNVDSLTRSIYNGFTAYGNSGFQPGNMGASLGRLAQVGYVGLNSAEPGADLRGCAQISGNTPAGVAACGANTARFGWGGTRIGNSIGYISPSFSGATIQVQYATSVSDRDDVADKTQTDSMNFGLSYAAGPIALSVARDEDELKSEGTTVTNRAAPLAGNPLKIATNMVGASYDLGAAKVFLVHTDKEFKFTGSKLSATVSEIGVQIPFGALQLVGSYSDGSLKEAGGDGKTELSAYQLQANYTLSKRTRVFAMFGESESKDPEDKAVLDGMTFGVQHTF